jgi:hypothetical protein
MRTIDWEKPLSGDDREWLEQRLTPELIDKIAENDAKFNKESDTESAKAPAFEDDYDKWKVEELKAECDGREPPVDIAGLSKKADIIAALRTWDAEHPEAIEA